MSEPRSALIVIDVQRGILAIPGLVRKAEIEGALDNVVRRICDLIERARRSGSPVFFVQHDGGSGHRLEPGTDGWKLRAELVPDPGDPIIRKRASDAFFETRLHSELVARRISRLAIAGCMTQFCVDTSVRRAVSLGFDTILASDAHTTADSETLRFEQIVAHHNALLDGFDAGDHEVRVLPSAEIIFE